MSLFERIQNKRYNLQESGPNDPKFFTGKTEDKFQGSKEGKKLRNIKKKSTPSITRGSGVGPTERINPDDIKTQQTQDKIVKQRVKSAQKSGNISDFTNKPIEGAPDTKKLIRGKKGETIANPIKPTKKTISKTSGTTQLKGVKDTELKPKTTGDEGSFRRNARRRKITGDVMPKKDLPKLTKTVGVNQADVSKKAQEFTKKINKQRIVKQKNIFGGEDTVKAKRKVGSTTSRGTRTNTKTKTPTVSGQQKLNLGDVTQKTPKTRLSKSGEVLKDLRTVKKKYPRGQRPKMSSAELKKVVKQASKPEKMVIAPDPVKGGFQKVGATTTTGKKVLKTSISTDELVGNKKKIEKKIEKKIVNNKKSTPKPNLFNRIKEKGKKLFKPTPMKDYPEFKQIRPNSVTRPVFGKGIVGQSRKYLSKVPGRYKGAALAIAGTVAAGAYAKKKLFPAPKPEPKTYYTRPVKLTLKKDLGYRSDGAKNPITTKLKNDRATSLPPKTPASGFYKKK